MLPIKVSNFVSRVTILFSKSSLLSFKSEIMSYMIFWVWKTGLRGIEKIKELGLNYMGPGRIGQFSELEGWCPLGNNQCNSSGASANWTLYLAKKIPGYVCDRGQDLELYYLWH